MGNGSSCGAISKRGRWMAAVFASEEGAVLSHRSAGRLWRLLPAAVEWANVTCSATQIERRGTIGHRSSLREAKWVVEDAIPWSCKQPLYSSTDGAGAFRALPDRRQPAWPAG